jgi:hypothetical protein
VSPSSPAAAEAWESHNGEGDIRVKGVEKEEREDAKQYACNMHCSNKSSAHRRGNTGDLQAQRQMTKEEHHEKWLEQLGKSQRKEALL